MRKEEYKNIFEQEETHFFYRHIHTLVKTYIEKYAKKYRPLSLLDAGCGTGLLAKKLERFGTVVGIDNSLDAIRFAVKRNISIKKASVTKLPFPKEMFDVVVSIDVLYHQSIKNDGEVLKEFKRVLKPRGILILRVPALSWLRLSHDKVVYTRERYDKEQLKQKLENAGFLILKLSYVQMLLVPGVLFLHCLESLHSSKNPSSSVAKVPFILNAFTSFLLSLERFIMRFTSLPIGIGLMAVCRKQN